MGKKRAKPTLETKDAMHLEEARRAMVIVCVTKGHPGMLWTVLYPLSGILTQKIKRVGPGSQQV